MDHTNYPPAGKSKPQPSLSGYSPEFEKQALGHLQSIRNSAHCIAWFMVGLPVLAWLFWMLTLAGSRATF